MCEITVFMLLHKVAVYGALATKSVVIVSSVETCKIRQNNIKRIKKL